MSGPFRLVWFRNGWVPLVWLTSFQPSTRQAHPFLIKKGHGHSKQHSQTNLKPFTPLHWAPACLPPNCASRGAASRALARLAARGTQDWRVAIEVFEGNSQAGWIRVSGGLVVVYFVLTALPRCQGAVDVLGGSKRIVFSSRYPRTGLAGRCPTLLGGKALLFR